MIVSLPFQIIKTFSEYLKVEVNFIELHKKYDHIVPEKELDKRFWASLLSEIGQDCQLSFFSYTLKAEIFEEAVRSQAIPMLVWIKDRDGDATPIIVYGCKHGKVLGYRFKNKEREALQMTIDELHGCLDVEPNGSVCVITPLVISSLTGETSAEKELNKQPASHIYHSSISPVKRLWMLLGSERKDITYIYFYAIAVGITSLITPLTVQSIVNLTSSGMLMEPAIILIMVAIVSTFFGGFLQIKQAQMVEILNQRIFAKAAFEFAFRIPRVRLEAINNIHIPEMMNRFFEVLTIQKGFSKLLTDFLAALLQIVFGLVLLAFYHSLFIIFGAFLVVILLIIFRMTGPKGLATNLEESKYKYKVLFWIEEVSRTLSTFKLAGLGNLAQAKMDEYVNYYLKKRQSHFKVLITQFWSIVIFKTLITSALLILGVYLINQREISIGQFVAAEIVIILVIAAIEKIILNLEKIYDILTALDKLGQVTDLPLEYTGGVHIDNVTPLKDSNKGFAIRVQHLKYHYPNAKPMVLNGVNIDIAAGEKLGVIGPTCAGKSTFLQVVTGLLSDYEGVITYDKVSMRDLNISSLRDQVGDNLTYEDIFDGTIEENIALGKPTVKLADILKAIEMVGLNDWFHQQPHGLRTKLGPGGKHLTRCTIQRIILARSLAEDPRLLVIDESFFNLDSTFDDVLLKKIFAPEAGYTLLAVSHNPAVLALCDRVALMQEGRITQIAPFETLMKDPQVRAFIPTFQLAYGPDFKF